MSARNFLILLIFTVVGVAAAALAVVTRPGDDAYANQGEPVFPGLIDAINDIETIRLESNEGGVLTFKRHGKGANGKEAAGWGVVELDMYPAKASMLNGLAVRVSQLTYLAPKTADPKLFPRLDLGDPMVVGSKAVGVTMTAKGGRPVVDMVVGKARSSLEGSAEGGTYLRLEGKDQAWLAKGSVDLGKLFSEWIDAEIFDIKTSRFRHVEIDYADGEKVVIFKDKEEDLDFILEDIPDGMKVKSRFSVNAIASSIGEYRIFDVAHRDKHPIDPAKSTRVVYETFDGLKITALIQLPEGDGKGPDAEYWVSLKVEGGEGTAEADGLRARVEPWVFRITDYRYNSIAKRMKDLIEPNAGS